MCRPSKRSLFSCPSVFESLPLHTESSKNVKDWAGVRSPTSYRRTTLVARPCHALTVDEFTIELGPIALLAATSVVRARSSVRALVGSITAVRLRTYLLRFGQISSIFDLEPNPPRCDLRPRAQSEIAPEIQYGFRRNPPRTRDSPSARKPN